MRIAERVAERYLLAVTRKPTTIPDGSSRTAVGPFELFVAPDKLKHEKAAIKALEATESKFRAAHLPLRGRVVVVLAGSIRRSYFSPMELLIRLSVSNLNQDGIGTLIHEAVHWQHDFHIPGGSGNRTIATKYFEVIRQKIAPGTGSSQDQARRKLDRIKKKIRDLDARSNEPPTVEKGDILTVDFSGIGGLQVRVQRVLRNGVKVRFVTPTEVTNRYWPSGEVTLQPDSVRKALGGDAQNEQLKQERAQLMQEAQAAHREFKDAEKGEDRVDAVLSPWLPTLYARTDMAEWFAELVMVRVTKPSLLTDEVIDWIKAVW